MVANLAGPFGIQRSARRNLVAGPFGCKSSNQPTGWRAFWLQGLLVAGSNQRSANLAGPFGCKSYMKEMFSAEVDDQQKIRLSARLRPRKPNIRDNAFPVNFHVVCGCKKNGRRAEAGGPQKKTWT